MHSADHYKDKAVRSKPSQARGKERVRVILEAALALFQERGVEEVTTNEIAERAGVPIGSLYRYFPGKDSILVAVTELYTDDIAKHFRQVGRHPMLEYLSWDEILVMMVDGWVEHSRANGPFTFLYAELANPRLRQQNKDTWRKFIEIFVVVLKKRCPELTDRQALICFELCRTSVEIGINDKYEKLSVGGPAMYHEAVGVVAGYMLRVCNGSGHHGDTLLA